MRGSDAEAPIKRNNTLHCLTLADNGNWTFRFFKIAKTIAARDIIGKRARNNFFKIINLPVISLFPCKLLNTCELKYSRNDSPAPSLISISDDNAAKRQTTPSDSRKTFLKGILRNTSQYNGGTAKGNNAT